MKQMQRRVALSDHYLAFVLLNLADLFLTGAYFRQGGWEANRAAAWILQAFGLRGLAIYKFLLVLCVVGVCEAVYTRRPETARMLILGGCALYGLLICWQIRGLLLMALTP